MLSGVFNAAFSYISASSSSSTGNLSRGNVHFSTADEEGKSTAMSPTDSTTRMLLLHHDTLQGHHHNFNKERLVETQQSITTGLLNQLFLFDELITRSIGFYAHPKTNFQHNVRRCCKVLEISGHGVLWFGVSGLILLLYLYTGNNMLFDYGINMLIVLIVDILVVAPTKLVFKRPRPILNRGSIPLSMSSIDKYAFPSGHASRCVALAAYFCYMPPFNPWTHLWYIWGLLVSLSRVALGRHHVLDVVAGMVAGVFIFGIARHSGLFFGA